MDLRKQLHVTAIAALGGMLYGLDIGLFAKIQTFETFQSQFQLDNIQLGILVATLLFGSILGSGISSILSEKIGRKLTIMAASILFCVGVIIQTFGIYGYLVLLLGRLITGESLGILSSVVPTYLSEIASKNIRGRLVGTQHFAITLGILSAFFAAIKLEKATIWILNDWQIATIMQVIPALTLLSGMFSLPYSPRWLISTERYDDATKAMLELGQSDYDSLVFDLLNLPSKRESIKAIWFNYQKPLMLGLSLHIFQQLSGANALVYYYKKMYGNIFPEYADTLALAQTILKVVSTIPALLLVDRVGRRPLLVAGSLGCALSCFGVSISVTFSYQVLAVVFIYSFVIFFAISLGPLPWILVGEIFPSNIRSKAVSLCVTINLFSNLIVQMLSPTLFANLGSNTFIIFGTFCLLAFVFCYRHLPETMMMSLEDIDSMFSKQKNHEKSFDVKVDKV
eukprot:NODE_56_length_28873_cov_1.243101.p6 type:complete len:454 gc:universal NODE_56_length_28873_cov_1.243101:10120-8759(-)